MARRRIPTDTLGKNGDSENSKTERQKIKTRRGVDVPKDDISGIKDENVPDPSPTPTRTMTDDAPPDLNRGRRATNSGGDRGSSTTDATTSTPSNSGSSSSGGVPDDLNRGRRATTSTPSAGELGTSPDAESQVQSRGQPEPATSGTDTSDLADSIPGFGTGDGRGNGKGSGRPADLNRTRRTPTAKLGNQNDADPSPAEQVEVTNTFTSEQGLEKNESTYLEPDETTQRARGIEQQVIEDTAWLDDPDEIRVTKDGVELTASGREAQTEFARTQAAEDVASELPGVDTGEVNVSGVPGDLNVSLTEEGRTGAAGLDVADPFGGRRQIQEDSLEQRFADAAGSAVSTSEVSADASGDRAEVSVRPAFGVTSVASRQGGRRGLQETQIAERVAGASDMLDAEDLDVSFSDGDVDVGIAEGARIGPSPLKTADPGGGRRQIQEDSLEQGFADLAGSAVTKDEVSADTTGRRAEVSVRPAFGVTSVASRQGGLRGLQREQIKQRVDRKSDSVNADDLLVSLSGGDVDVGLNDAARAERIRESIAEDRENVQRSDVNVEFDASGASVSLSKDAREDIAQDKIASKKDGVDPADVEVQFKDGEIAGAEIEENFDDNGNFFGIKNAEDDVEAFVQGTGEFMGGIGTVVGGVGGAALQIPADATGLSPKGQKEIFDFGKDAGRRAAKGLNPTQLLTVTDELGEYAIGSGERILSGDAGTIGPDTAESATRITSAIEKDFNENPYRFTAGLVGSAVLAGGAMKLAQGTRAAGATRFAVQPGEELIAAGTGVRVSNVARSGVSSAAARAPDVNVRQFGSSNRGQITFDSRTDTESDAGQIELTGDETAADFDRPVSELPVSESTREQILRNTAKADEARSSDPVGDIESEADIEAEALDRMPPAEAFPSKTRFQEALERRKAQVRDELSTSGVESNAESGVSTQSSSALGGRSPQRARGTTAEANADPAIGFGVINTGTFGGDPLSAEGVDLQFGGDAATSAVAGGLASDETTTSGFDTTTFEDTLALGGELGEEELESTVTTSVVDTLSLTETDAPIMPDTFIPTATVADTTTELTFDFPTPAPDLDTGTPTTSIQTPDTDLDFGTPDLTIDPPSGRETRIPGGNDNEDGNLFGDFGLSEDEVFSSGIADVTEEDLDSLF